MMIKKSGLVVVLVLLFSGPFAFAQTADSIYEPGDFVVSAAVSFLFPLGVAIYPGAELFITGINVADTFPIDFSVAVRGQIGTASYSDILFGYSYGYTTFGGGPFASAHLSFKDMQNHSLNFLENFDFYAGFGVVFNYFSYTGDYLVYWASEPTFRVGFGTYEGVNWYISDSFALKLEFVYWGWLSASASLGVQLKF